MLRAISDVPVIIATARDDEAEIVRLLQDGADDYLVKPFSGDHLHARIEAVLRRARTAPATAPIRVGGLTVDPARREAALDGRPLELTRREFDLLAYLGARPDRVVSRKELLTEVWRQSYGDDQTIDVHLSWLRRKLGRARRVPGTSTRSGGRGPPQRAGRRVDAPEPGARRRRRDGHGRARVPDPAGRRRQAGRREQGAERRRAAGQHDRPGPRRHHRPRATRTGPGQHRRRGARPGWRSTSTARPWGSRGSAGSTSPPPAPGRSGSPAGSRCSARSRWTGRGGRSSRCTSPTPPSARGRRLLGGPHRGGRRAGRGVGRGGRPPRLPDGQGHPLAGRRRERPRHGRPLRPDHPGRAARAGRRRAGLQHHGRPGRRAARGRTGARRRPVPPPAGPRSPRCASTSAPTARPPSRSTGSNARSTPSSRPPAGRPARSRAATRRPC